MRVILEVGEDTEKEWGYIEKQQRVMQILKKHCKTSLLVKDPRFLAGVNAVAHALTKERTLK